MDLKELCEKLDTTLREYPLPARKGTTAWACQVNGLIASERGFVMGLIGFGRTQAMARKSLARQLRGKTVSIPKEPTCGHTSPCSHTLSLTVPTDLKA